jgi:hypothetical protein
MMIHWAWLLSAAAGGFVLGLFFRKHTPFDDDV